MVERLDDILVRPLGQFRFVGKSDPVPIVEILTMKATASATQLRLCERFAEARDAFCTQQWSRGVDLFEAILRDNPDDGPASFFLDRCRRYASTSPPTEDPSVIRMDVK